MGGDIFRFKQFVIHQAQSAMKVGTDGVLLGSWVDLRGTERHILDIGTGTGLIALMVAQRSSAWQAKIEAVEIEVAAATEAQQNVNNSPWKSSIKVSNIDFQTFAARATDKYDLVVSNPPYFNGTYKSKDVERTAARHSELLNSDDLLFGVTSVLDEKGRFVAIFPYQTAAVFVAKAASAGLFCNRIMEIYSKPSSGIKRVMAEFSFTKRLLITEKLTILNAEGDYSEDLRRLTCDFYLKF
ncbi:MAG: methyltransferase [Mucinivorans sp.]